MKSTFKVLFYLKKGITKLLKYPQKQINRFVFEDKIKRTDGYSTLFE